ncbi:glycosyltransferase [Derxia gummosa]|uniref:Glycosyltransferase n=1 Tax=Derxia gummosa DSM 723 TaxID=1121388 RepID=A0A8B6XCG4_9BURK|nr:glycosyltransferase [Derxia gummosa]
MQQQLTSRSGPDGAIAPGLAGRGAPSAVAPTASAILHVAGRVDQRAFAYIGAACRALDAFDVVQVVVMFANDRHRKLHESLPPGVQVIVVPVGWLALRAVLQKVLTDMRFSAIHLHGLLPCLMSAFLLGESAHRARVFYSPHGSRAVTTWRRLGLVLTRAVMRLTGAASQTPVATVPHEAHWLRRSTGTDTDLLEAAVPDAYFDAIRADAEVDGLIVAAAGSPDDDQAVSRFTRLAVFLASETPPVRFCWVGEVDAPDRARLKAAGVEIVVSNDDVEIARRLASAAIYVQPDTDGGFPIRLASAMAAGCACVAQFSFGHADLIRHGSTGLIAHSPDEFVRYVGYLLENAAQRNSLAKLARDEARRRFRMTEFRDAVVRLYGIAPANTEPLSVNA